MTTTIQGVYNAMVPERREAADLIFGALAQGESNVGSQTPIGNKTLGEVFGSMSVTEQNVVAFIAGGVQSTAKHSEAVDNFLAHYGRKGMKWGQHIFETSGGGTTSRLSKSTSNTPALRKAARQAVKNDITSVGVAHIAALKSTGHRVANGVLGDKTFWKKQGIIVGATLGGIGLVAAAPAVLPASIFAHIGVATGTAKGFALAGGTQFVTNSAAVEAGKYVAVAAGLKTVAAANTVANLANYGGTVKRAITGNAKIDRSYQQLGVNVHKHQMEGSARVQKILNREGSISKKNLHHDATASIDNFLAHYGRRGMKWGQHIFTSSGGGAPKASKKLSSHAPSDDHAAATAALHKPSHALSNQEMQALITRLNLERQYSQVVHPAQPSSRSKKAAQWAGKLMLDVGKQELTRVAKASAALQVEAAIRGKQPSGKKFRKDLARRITPGGGKKSKQK